MEGVQRMRNALQDNYQMLPFRDDLERQVYMDHLAFTLGSRRSHLSWRSFSICAPQRPLSLDDGALLKLLRRTGRPKLAFVFTGQGACLVG